MVLALDQVWVGVAEIGLGLIFCLVGYSAARVVLGLWGALVGFVGGTAVYVYLTEQLKWVGLAVVPWWVFAIGFGLLVAWLAFAFYAIGVFVSMGAVGWALGQVIASAMHLPGWVTFSLGMVVAAGLIMVGWTLNLPRLLLIVLTAVAGAGWILGGVQELIHQRVDWFDQVGWHADFFTHAAWTVAYIVLAGAGMVVQSRQHSDPALRDAYKSA